MGEPINFTNNKKHRMAICQILLALRIVGILHKLKCPLLQLFLSISYLYFYNELGWNIVYNNTVELQITT